MKIGGFLSCCNKDNEKVILNRSSCGIRKHVNSLHVLNIVIKSGNIYVTLKYVKF